MRAIHRWSSSRLRTVWYLLRSILVLRAASARAAASEMGVRDSVSGLRPCATRGALAPPFSGSVGAAGGTGVFKRTLSPPTTSPSRLAPAGGGGKQPAPALNP